MTATPKQLAQLRAVNDQINAIPYQGLGADQTQDVWIDAPSPGMLWECRDYTIAKAKALREQGWPPADMGVVLCWTEPEPPGAGQPPIRQYHAVLGCNAGGEVWILDSRTADIYRWDQCPYDYLWAHQQIAGSTEFRDARGGLIT
ncbi:MAG TPA: transglutaminase-like cysteine peptidase [Bradyrhizobium sp.]|nr:transglutaminase-like cysteine peptidase [Bradyrhizobium sp.]